MKRVTEYNKKAARGAAFLLSELSERSDIALTAFNRITKVGELTSDPAQCFKHFKNFPKALYFCSKIGYNCLDGFLAFLPLSERTVLLL